MATSNQVELPLRTELPNAALGNKAFTAEEDLLLKTKYPEMGKSWCKKELGRTEASIRARVSRLGLKLDKDSRVLKNGHLKQGETLRGRKRPEHSIRMIFLCTQTERMDHIRNWSDERRLVASVTLKETRKNNPKMQRATLGRKLGENEKNKLLQGIKRYWKRMTPTEKSAIVIKMQKAKREKYGSISPKTKRGSWYSGWRTVGGKRIYFRSRWEANYARYLEFLKEKKVIRDWEHEPKTFWFDAIKRGTVSYLPDFFVIEMDESTAFHEVKGWMDSRSKTALRRMKKYYPEIKIILIRQKQYKQIEKKVGSLCVGWENNSDKQALLTAAMRGDE